MNLAFTKYQGTGNDFILLDGSDVAYQDILEKSAIARLCDRHFGIGADGLIIISPHQSVDFQMLYYNSDGNESTMCGNGGRCASHFAESLGLCSKTSHFEAIDGYHRANIVSPSYVELSMNNVSDIEAIDNHSFQLETGSPHYVRFIEDLSGVDIVDFGREVRYSPKYNKNGINVNLATHQDNKLEIRTYERGVEDETLSCGTGVTAAGIAASLYYPELKGKQILSILTKGGELKLKFKQSHGIFTNIWLCGEVRKVFDGQISL